MDALLIGYGTLLYQESMATTVGASQTAAKTFVPVTVRGYRRLCNLRPTHYEPSFRISQEPIEAGALNVEPAAGHAFNALAFAVTGKELEALDSRERYYERQLVDIVAFGSEESAGKAYVYASRPDASWIVRDPRQLLPRWEDVIWPRTGAYRIGEAFGRFYDESTFLADGRTRVIDRYRAHLEKDQGDIVNH